MNGFIFNGIMIEDESHFMKKSVHLRVASQQVHTSYGVK